MTEINTTTPTEQHQAASADYAAAQAAQSAAEAVLAEGLTAQQRLLDSASSGDAISTADVRRAQDVVRESEAAVMLARAVAEGKQRLMFKLEIPHLGVIATDAETAMANTAAAFLKESEEIDSEIVRLRDRLLVRDDLYRAVNTAIFKAESHTNVVAERATVNTVMGAQHSSVWPKCRTPLRVETTSRMPVVDIGVTQKLLSMGHIMEWMASKQTLAGMVRSTFGAILPKPTPEEVA